VIAYEADHTLAVLLKRKFLGKNTIQVREADFLNSKLSRVPYKVFSNIPFNITADVIRKLLRASNSPEDVYLIVQKESAVKYSGVPYGKETLFSTSIKPWYELSIEHNFKRSDFIPQPSVEVVLLHIHRRHEPLVQNEQATLYKDFISYVYNRSIPNLQTGLKKIVTSTQFSILSRNLGIKSTVTPTQLTFDQWLLLFQTFMTHVDKHKQQIVAGSAIKIEKEQAGIEKIHRTRVSRNWKDEAVS
jgi:23S rRNA (adenine-N6)-dimethyltransferase